MRAREQEQKKAKEQDHKTDCDGYCRVWILEWSVCAEKYKKFALLEPWSVCIFFGDKHNFSILSHTSLKWGSR